MGEGGSSIAVVVVAQVCVLTASAVDCKEALRVSRGDAIGNLLQRVDVSIFGNQLEHFNPTGATFRHGRIIDGFLRERDVVVFVLDLDEDLVGIEKKMNERVR